MSKAPVEETENPVGLFDAEVVKDREPAVYEIGYHLLPTLGEAEIAAAVKDLTNFLKKEGADFVGEKAPEKIDLAYPLEKRIAGARTNFMSAHFGWVAFSITPEKTVPIKVFMDSNPSVLRYLLISTSKDEVTAVLEGKVLVPTAAASTDAIAAPKRDAEEGGPISEVKLDAAIESMTDEA